MTVIRGANGEGKTSLLEAIGYASTRESFRHSPREALVRNGSLQAIIRCAVALDARSSLIEIAIPPPRRDHVLLNRQPSRRGADLLEALQVTVFTPDDLELVKGGPQARRNYLDDGLVAARPRLLEVRQLVEKVLRQRAMLLRQAGGRPSREIEDTLDVWDEQLARAGEVLISEREAFVTELSPLVAEAFSRLTGLPGDLSLSYQRSFAGSLLDALHVTRAEALRRATTSVGPHRDELAILFGELDARTRLSQGRQRAVTLSLRLGAHQLVARHRQSSPVLLLDDAFSELDDRTASALLKELPSGQALLTTAGPLPKAVQPISLVNLVDGSVRG